MRKLFLLFIIISFTALVNGMFLVNPCWFVSPSGTTWNDIDTGTYDSKIFNPVGEDKGLIIKPDGTKLYVSTRTYNKIEQFTLSTPWDVSTATSDSKSLNVSSETTDPVGIFINPTDGKTIFVVGYDTGIHQYTLSTAWDISTATYTSKSLLVTAGVDLFVKDDGINLYFVSENGDKVKQYGMSTPWDISTATDTGKDYYLTSNCSGLFIKPDDGTKLYHTDALSNDIRQHTLSTPWDVSTATYDNKNLAVSATPTAVVFKPDGSKFYIADKNDGVRQYSL
jgi:hypothetical protein